MPIHIHGIQNISSPFRDAVYTPGCKKNFKRCYSKAMENFQIAFSKEKYGNIEYSFYKNAEDFNNREHEWDVPDPYPRSLDFRITYFVMGCIYSSPIINLIIYVALNRFQPRHEYRALTYEETIEKAKKKFHRTLDDYDIVDRIKERLKDCNYKEDVENGRRPQIDIIDSDYFNDPLGMELDDEMQNNYKAIKFIQHLPKMHIASVPKSYYYK